MLLSDENGRWKKKGYGRMQKSSVASHAGADSVGEAEDGAGENSTGEAGLAPALKARRLRGNPPHTLLSVDGEKFSNEFTLGLSWKPPQALLARLEAGDCSDGRIFVWVSWERGAWTCESGSWLVPVVQADRLKVMMSRAVIAGFIIN